MKIEKMEFFDNPDKFENLKMKDMKRQISGEKKIFRKISRKQ